MSDMKGRSEVRGGVVSTVVKSLETNPMLLALLVLNAIMIGVAVWYLDHISDRNTAIFKTVMESCLPRRQ